MRGPQVRKQHVHSIEANPREIPGLPATDGQNCPEEVTWEEVKLNLGPREGSSMSGAQRMLALTLRGIKYNLRTQFHSDSFY